MNTRFAITLRQCLHIAILILALTARPEWAVALAQTPGEIDAVRRFTAEKLLTTEAANLPFSFVYAGEPSGKLLPTWRRKAKSDDIDADRRRTTVEYVDPKTGLQVRCEAIEFRDFPTVEWTLYFKNTGAADTPILEKVQSLDMAWQRSGEREFLLHHAVGSPATPSDYGPLETPLKPGSSKRIAAAGGRPTNSDWSYFNLQDGDRGTIIVVGWPGQWASEFVRDAGRGIRVRAGQELVHTKLRPGEEIRSPLMVLQFWRGDRDRSQNIWRRWMMAHSMPRPGGKLPAPQFLGSSSGAYGEMIGANEQNQIMHIDRYLEEGLKLDYWWMDAGWYIQQNGWPQVGTWEVDPRRFPRGLRAISDHAHAKGVKIVVWFEPERVAPGTWLYAHHPEWLLRTGAGDNDTRLLDLGNPAARGWLTEHVDKLLTEQGIDLYRQDFNIDPLAFWRAADAKDRQGIAENKYVCGYLAYWDELRRRHPNMLIDACASGGRRNDLETMRRAVPMWRSDYAFEPIGHQCMTYGISLWLPYHGTGTRAGTGVPANGGWPVAIEPYVFWSNTAPSLVSVVDVRDRKIDYAALGRLCRQWRQLAEVYYADFYPLTPYTQDNRAWIAWQFNDPEHVAGAVQAFRRVECGTEKSRFRLHDLISEATYEITSLEQPGTSRATGRELMTEGLEVILHDRPSAAVVLYRRAK